MLRQLIEQAIIGAVSEYVFAGVGHSSGVEISIEEPKLSRADVGEKTLVVVECVVYAGDVEIFSLVGRNFEIESLKRSDLRHKLEKESQNPRAESWTPVSFAPLPLILGARQVVAKFASVEVGGLGHQFFRASSATRVISGITVLIARRNVPIARSSSEITPLSGMP